MPRSEMSPELGIWVECVNTVLVSDLGIQTKIRHPNQEQFMNQEAYHKS